MPTTRLRITGVVGAVALLLGGCGGGVEGTPVAELWDPCSISPQPIADLTLRPAPVSADDFLPQGSEWKTCTWRNDWYFLTAFSATVSAKDLGNDARMSQRIQYTIDGRTVFSFVDRNSPESSCSGAIDVRRGAVELNVRTALGEAARRPLCDVAKEAVVAFLPYLPK
ncbi:DUF3558 family protein [Rhodococcoides corynebacterioides]|uniref:DUF3558 family protein n=1 Tax=Rhodococcoides corynebacterioides TaxID=53972 RepID=UPI000933AD8D|nr:DUF3558 family protein [Rhodococcus corynebacterioides]